jgi:multidrug efflux system membrane fusion protein
MRRKLLVAGAAVVIAGGVVAGLARAWGSAAEEPAATPALPPATAKVAGTTLVDTKTVSGTLGYGEAVPVSAAQTGTLTWIAAEGAAVKRGEPLFKVDQRPVVALYGSVPLYRPLRAGIEGPDVEQFEANLSKLGYTGFTVDQTYTAATATAARRWQADLGLTKTGAVEPGQVVVTPGAVLVAERTAWVGDRLGGDPGGGRDGGAEVLSYTGTTRLVTVQLEVADQALAARSRRVTVTVPGRGAVKGTISQVGTVATTPETASGTPGGSDAAAGAAGGSSSAAAAARIEVTVTVAEQNKLGSLDAAPVDVDFVSQQRKDVLAVPVAALLALPKGGYGVQVVQGGATRIVAVKTGMFAAGQVEVSGAGIAEGVTVGVPK